MYKIVIHKKALRYLNKIPSTQKDKIKDSLTKLSDNPVKTNNVKPMLGEWKGYYRMRIGNIRAIFWIDQNKRIIYVDHIGLRGDIYKNP